MNELKGLSLSPTVAFRVNVEASIPRPGTATARVASPEPVEVGVVTSDGALEATIDAPPRVRVAALLRVIVVVVRWR